MNALSIVAAKNSKHACVVFFPGVKPKKWAYVAKLKGFAFFLNSKHSGWEYMNVYNGKGYCFRCNLTKLN